MTHRNKKISLGFAAGAIFNAIAFIANTNAGHVSAAVITLLLTALCVALTVYFWRVD